MAAVPRAIMRVDVDPASNSTRRYYETHAFVMSSDVGSSSRQKPSFQFANHRSERSFPPGATASILDGVRHSIDNHVRLRIEQNELPSQEPVLDVLREFGQDRKNIRWHGGEWFSAWIVT